MKRRTSLVVLGIAMFVMGLPVMATAEGRGQPGLDQAAAEYSQQIRSLFRRSQYRQAIAVAADYEQEMLSRYPIPSYEMGLFQCEADHITFHCPFVDWRRAEVEDESVFNKLRMAGWDVLLALEGGNEQQSLLVFCVNVKRLEQRLGMQAEGPDLASDQGLQFAAQIVAGQIGVVRSQGFRMVGDHRVLAQEVAPAMMGPEVRVMILLHGQRLFGFLLTSTPSEIATDEARLEELVKTASFDYGPEDSAAIAGVRECTDAASVDSLLAAVERLAKLGQFNAAAEDLTRLRHLLYQHMPKATVAGTTGSCPAYGISFENPDPAKWNMSTLNDGVFQAVVLEDKYSVNQEGVLVGVIDSLVAFGPQFIELLNEDEETQRQSLIDMGRGGAVMLGTIESERLVPFAGQMAYEAVVVPNLPGVKMRIQFFQNGDYAVQILVVAGARDFESRIAECDRIVAQYVRWNDQAVYHGTRAAGDTRSAY